MVVSKKKSIRKKAKTQKSLLPPEIKRDAVSFAQTQLLTGMRRWAIKAALKDFMLTTLKYKKPVTAWIVNEVLTSAKKLNVEERVDLVAHRKYLMEATYRRLTAIIEDPKSRTIDVIRAAESRAEICGFHAKYNRDEYTISPEEFVDRVRDVRENASSIEEDKELE